MSDNKDRAAEALEVCERLYGQIVAEGRTPPVWFMEYRVSLRMLVNGVGIPFPEEPPQLNSYLRAGTVH